MTGSRTDRTMIKILFDALCIVPPRLSGVGHVALETLRALDEHPAVSRGTVTVVAFVPLGKKKYLSRYKFSHVRCRELPLPARLLAVFSRIDLPLPLELWLGRGLYIFPNFRNFRLLFACSATYIHDVCFAVFPESVSPSNLSYLQRNATRWIRRSSKVITVSQASKDELCQYLSVAPGKVLVLPNSVDTRVFKRQSPTAIVEARQAYDLPSEYVLTLGNIEPRKNLERLVEAAMNVLSNKSIALVIIGGDGWLNEPIHKAIDRAREQGVNIVLPQKYVEDAALPAIISGAKALLQVSIHEGFGMPVVEAVACGTPVVIADLPVLHELVEQPLAVVNPYDIQSIADGLQQAIDSQKPAGQDNKGAIYFDAWKNNATKLIELAKDQAL